MQADVASGRLQLKDGGERLQEGIGAAAASLARALGALAQRGAADPPWPPACFQSGCLRFIDADGQIQVISHPAAITTRRPALATLQ